MPLSRGYLVRPARGVAGWWQAAAILAPVLLLAGLGIRGLQVSRQAALEEARRQANRTLMDALPALGAVWEKMRAAAPILRLYPTPPVPTLPGDADRIYDEALALSLTSPAQAAATLAQLETDHPDAFSASGVPLVPLAEWNRLRLETHPAAITARAAALRTAALREHPSVLTPDLLASGAELLRARGLYPAALESWREEWNEDERARSVWRQHEREVAAARSSLWLTGPQGQTWWVRRDGGTTSQARQFFSRDALSACAQTLAAEMQPLLPDYARLGVTLDNVPLRKVQGASLADRVLDGLSLSVVLVSPERLYAQQRQQTFWLAALLACALAATLAGFYAMRRALAGERRLGQLKSDFVSSVSHELRAPVASMRLMAENLEAGIVPTESRRQDYHRHIAEECRRLSALIDNVLDFARIEQDRKAYDFAETDVSALVRDALDFMQPRAAQRRQNLRCELSPIESAPLCDGLAVRQAVLNLLDNAIKFSPENTAICLRLRSLDTGTWEVAVADEGPGIPAAEHEAIFERFYRRGSELRRETQGAGIGLSIVQHIARAHGGCVRLDSESGKGAIFALVLPMRPPGAAQ